MSKYCYHCMSQLNEDSDFCTVCGTNIRKTIPAHHLLPGTLLDGKFYVGEVLGEGGFGITYIGRDIKLDMKVAIKEYYPNGYVNRNNTISPYVNDSVTEGRHDFFEKGRERFLKEARILAKFSGEPGIVDVRDFFEENNTAYIIMEYLDGVDLKTYLKQKGTLTPEHTIRLLMPIMNSLKKVHAQGLIHRDISPDNIMIVGEKVKLLDFGAARAVSADANKSLSVMLKPGYAPEEQYRSKGNQGPWTDIYALCATMYKCITGITPDDATQRVFSDEVMTPSALNVAIRPEVEKAIMKGMSVNQNDRYSCVEDLIRGLQGIEVSVSEVDHTVMIIEDHRDDVVVNDPPIIEDTTEQSDEDKTLYAGDIDEDKTVYVGDDNAIGTPAVNVRTGSHTSSPKDNVAAPEEKKPQGISKKSKIVLGVVVAVLLLALAALGTYIVKTLFFDSDGEMNNDAERHTVSDTVPYYLNSYVKPDSREDCTLLSSVIELDGALYQLPAPVSEFVDNGWAIVRSSSSDYVKSGETSAISMIKDGKEIALDVINFDQNSASAQNCAVYQITLNQKDSVAFSVGGSYFPVAIGDYEDKVISAIQLVSEDCQFDVYSGVYTTEYSYSEQKDNYYNLRNFDISIHVDKSTRQVSSITILCDTWNY